MKERLIPVPQDVLYVRLRDSLATGKVKSIKEIDEVSRPSFIRPKITIIGLSAYVDIHIIPQNEGSKIKYNFDFKRLLFTFLLVDVFAYIILLSLVLSQSIPFQVFRHLTALTVILGFSTPLYSYLDSKRRFSEQFKHLLHVIELEYEYETGRR